MTVTIAAPTVIQRADMIVREVMAVDWPADREAMAAIGYAAGYAAECIEIHRKLRTGWMDWADYDADLMFLGADPQREAIAIAADRALDAAKALLNRLREYQRREAVAGLWAQERRAS